jgi:peptidyl-prolyl cis-trans isomerase A (cyclophilin A)
MRLLALIRLGLLLMLLVTPLHAELHATFQTSRGDVIVALQYDKTPQTVANFITLASGSRNHLDPLTGAISRKLYYSGEKFFRVINDPSFKIAQTGSGTGTNSGGPGYSFRDDFHPSLSHVPYVLSMANSGVQTNGSQIFFTGNTSIPGLNQVHTVFGLITDLASRAVLDEILASGNDTTTITGVVFNRTDAAAVAFDEQAQNLPVCQGSPGNLAVTSGVAAIYQLTNPIAASSIFQAYRGTDLTSWSKLGEIYQGTGQSGSSAITLDNATLPRAFYQLPTVTYPDALAPASLSGRTLTAEFVNGPTFVFVFDLTGLAGTVADSRGPTPPVAFTLTGYSKSPYKASWAMTTSTLGSFQIVSTLKTETPLIVLGTQQLRQTTAGIIQSFSNGTLSLTK